MKVRSKIYNCPAAGEAEDRAGVALYYASGWALTQWESDLTTVAGDPDYVNIKQPASDDNFVTGQPHYDLYKAMYDAAQRTLWWMARTVVKRLLSRRSIWRSNTASRLPYDHRRL